MNFTGYVNVSLVGPGQSIQTVIVELSADCEDWRTEITPSILNFLPEDTGKGKTFNLSVTVPLETDREECRKVIVSGIMTTKPGFFEYSLYPTTGLVYAKRDELEKICDIDGRYICISYCRNDDAY